VDSGLERLNEFCIIKCFDREPGVKFKKKANKIGPTSYLYYVHFIAIKIKGKQVKILALKPER